MIRRAAFLLALALGLAQVQVQAQTWPAKPIRMIVPFSPGGGTDLLARVLARSMSEGLGQQVIVENKPGGNTLLGTEALVRAVPDGYTLLMQTNNLASNVTLYAGKLSFDTFKDMVPVSLVAGNPHVLVVNPSIKVTTLKEYIALAKAKPGQVTFASAGSGTVNHLSGELLKILANIDMLHVPYNGSGAVIPDLMGGQVDSFFAAMPNVTSLIRAGKLRAIAVTTPKRFKGLPDVPSIAELGYPGYDFRSWFGIVAPAGTPKPVVDRLNAEIVKSLKDPGVLAALGDYEIFGSSPEGFGTFIRAEVDKSAKLIRAAGAKVD